MVESFLLGPNDFRSCFSQDKLNGEVILGANSVEFIPPTQIVLGKSDSPSRLVRSQTKPPCLFARCIVLSQYRLTPQSLFNYRMKHSPSLLYGSVFSPTPTAYNPSLDGDPCVPYTNTWKIIVSVTFHHGYLPTSSVSFNSYFYQPTLFCVDFNIADS